MDALEALLTRRSVRKFKPDPVSREALARIVDAGRLAPTARNVQPWEFVVVTDGDVRRRLAELSEFGKFIANAPACIVVLATATRYYVEDGSAATANMLVAARALGLGSCWVAGEKKTYAPEIVATCGAPSHLRVVSLIAIGHPVEIPSPEKRTLDDVLHWDQFGR